jgi:hypothetical protein
MVIIVCNKNILESTWKSLSLLANKFKVSCNTASFTGLYLEDVTSCLQLCKSWCGTLFFFLWAAYLKFPNYIVRRRKIISNVSCLKQLLWIYLSRDDSRKSYKMYTTGKGLGFERRPNVVHVYTVSFSKRHYFNYSHPFYKYRSFNIVAKLKSRI